jgi:hypothetical protein
MQPMGQKMGLAAAAQAPQMQQPQGQGLDQVPIPEAMFDEQRMAGGGIVAFQAGGGVRNPRLIGALENVLAQLQARDPALNVDYVRRAVLSAPESQQRTLMQQLVERVGMDDQFKPAAASFTEALKTKEVDPTVMRAMQLAGGSKLLISIHWHSKRQMLSAISLLAISPWSQALPHWQQQFLRVEISRPV